jgi:peroxiredoxin Q/BCP
MEKGFAVLGVSADKVASQKKFSEKYAFQYPLIADTEKIIIKAYGAWGTKKFMGKVYDGIFRYTFVISESGLVENIFTKVDTKNHAEQILNEYTF